MKLPDSVVHGLKISLSIALLLLVFLSVDLSSIRSHLTQLRAGRLALLLMGYWAAQMISAQRWRIFASSLGMTGPYAAFLKMYFVGMFFNIGLPSLVGGDFIKAAMVTRRNDAPLEYGLASVVQDRACGLVILLLYGFGAALLYPLAWRGIPLWAAYPACGFAIAVMVLLLWKGRVFYGLFPVSGGRPYVEKVFSRLASFHEALGNIRLSRGALLEAVALSLVNSGIVIWIVYDLCRIVRPSVGLAPIAALVPLIEVVTMLPITISGLGIREWAYIESLALLGISAETALTVALTLSALIVVRSLGGAVFLPGVPKSLRQSRTHKTGASSPREGRNVL